MGGRFGELLLILIIALLLFGPNKLPSLAKALGEALKEFKKASNPEGDNKSAVSTQAAPTETKTSGTKDNSVIS